MADVFISYSRLDKEFVGQLREFLIAKDQEVWIDWESIPPSQAWWSEIQKGIAKANNFVLVMSPNSMASPICQMEIEYARQLKKRIIPVLQMDFEREACLVSITKRLAKKEETTTREIWGTRQPHDLFDINDAELKHINYFIFKSEATYQTRFNELFAIISTDYQHKEQHTTLQLRAEEWNRRNRDPSFLLNGNELDSAEEWLTNYDTDAAKRQHEGETSKLPEPTEVQRAYITISRREEDGRTPRLAELETSRLKSEGAAQAARRVLVGVAIISALILIGVVVITGSKVSDANALVVNANTQVETATSEQGQALNLANSAANQAAIAFTQVGHVNATLIPIPITLTTVGNQIATSQAAGTQVAVNVMENHALFMANLSEQQLNSNHPEEALLLALESIGHYGTLIPYPGEGSVAVQNVLDSSVQEIAYMHHDNVVRGAVWNGDESRILSWSDDKTARVSELLTVHNKAVARGVAWNDDKTRILGWLEDNILQVWDATSGAEILTLGNQSFSLATSATWNEDESRILAWGALDNTAQVWDATSGRLLLTLRHESPVMGAAWDKNESRIATGAADGTAQVWDATSGELLLVLHHEDLVWKAIWNDTGNRILTASVDGTVRVWNSDISELIAFAQSRKTRDLSNEKREQFFSPTLPPTPTANIPTVTPLPTLTPALERPSITPLPTLTPSLMPTGSIYYSPSTLTIVTPG